MLQWIQATRVGCPLVNLDRLKVIGVNSMSASHVPGVSFAVPSDLAKNFIKQLQVMDGVNAKQGLI